MSSGSLSSSVFLARQSLFNDNLNLLAYELMSHTDQQRLYHYNGPSHDVTEYDRLAP